MSFEVLTSRLHNVRTIRQDQIVAGCPLCQSRKGQPIAVKRLEDGRLLINAFCGCATSDVLGALGMKLADLFPTALGHHLPPARRAFDADTILAALAHELMVADLIACDIDRTGQYDADQRERMHMVAVRFANGLRATYSDRVGDDLRKIRRAVA
jgi:hypothetical protein